MMGGFFYCVHNVGYEGLVVVLGGRVSYMMLCFSHQFYVT